MLCMRRGLTCEYLSSQVNCLAKIKLEADQLVGKSQSFEDVVLMRVSALEFDVHETFRIVTVLDIKKCALEICNMKLCWAANGDESARTGVRVAARSLVYAAQAGPCVVKFGRDSWA